MSNFWILHGLCPFQHVIFKQLWTLSKSTICCIFSVYDKQVKVWCTKHEASVINIDMKANICCVKYNPGSSDYIAVCAFHLHFWRQMYGAKSFCIGFLLIFTTNQCGAELELWSALLTMCTALHTPPQKKKKKRDIDQCNSAILWFDPHVKLCACSCINKICYLTIFGWIWCFGDKPIV